MKPIVFILIAIVMFACGGRKTVFIGGNDAGSDLVTATDEPSQSFDNQPTESLEKSEESREESAHLPCDPGFLFMPHPPTSSVIFEVHYKTTVKGYVHVGMKASGPGKVLQAAYQLVNGQSPWQWKWDHTVDAEGIYTFTFTAEDPKQNIASCQIKIEYTGPPPPIEQPDCQDKFCGDPDGIGGKCQNAPCRLVGSFGGQCLAPASPIHPNGGCGTWSCLNDSNQCNSGDNCRIWCPFEKCLRPPEAGGCPQATEACWVGTDLTDYEAACRACCQSYGAFWDDGVNVCRDSNETYRGLPLQPVAPNGDVCSL